MAVVASHAAFGGYATNRHFRFGVKNKETTGPIVSQPRSGVGDTSVRSLRPLRSYCRDKGGSVSK